MPAILGVRIMQRLREIDRDRGWLARQLKVDLSLVHRWISGQRPLSEDRLREIGLVLHRSPAWLQGHEPDPIDDQLAVG